MAAAADLSSLERPLAKGFHGVTGQDVRFVLGASGMLAQQIRNGAPYDVFLSANEAFVRDLAASGDVRADSVRIYAYGRLGLWSKSGTVRSLADLARLNLLHVAIANPAHAPYGLAARQALEHAGLWRQIEPKIVYGEDVRQALQFAESGNAEAVITSWSLLFDRSGILLPAEWHAPIRQAGAVVTASKQREMARKFLDYLAGASGRATLQRHGFFPGGIVQ